MKITIISPHDDKSLNIDKDHTIIGWTEIPKIDDASCLEINLSNVLDYAVPHSHRNKALTQIIKKLRHNGVINIEGIDIIELCRSLYLGDLSVQESNKLIYNYKKLSCSTLLEIEEQLKGLGCEITRKRIDNTVYSISGKRL